MRAAFVIHTVIMLILTLMMWAWAWTGTIWMTHSSQILWKLWCGGVQIEWNLTHAKPNAVCYRTSEPGQNVYMGGMAIAKSEILDVLGTSIWSDLRWDDHVFNVSKEAAKCLGFLKWSKKYFTPSDLRFTYVTYIILDRKWHSIHIYGQVRLKAHLISWIIYKVERWSL